MRVHRFFGIFLPAALLMASALYGQVFKTQEAALQEFFADADTVLRQTLFLDDAQVDDLQKRSKGKFESQIITYYEGQKNGRPAGLAFFEDQVVRTKKAVVMVAVNNSGAIERLEVLAFYEPQDYLPTDRWFGLFKGLGLTPDLWPERKIHAVTGATLTVRAFTFTARRALALFQFIQEN